LRIVYLNPVSVLGGGERSLLDVLAAVRKKEPAASLYLISGEPGRLVEEARTLGVETTVLPMPPELLGLGNNDLSGGLRPLLALAGRGARAGMAARRYAADLSRILAELQPTLVHSNGIKFHLLTRMLRSHGRRGNAWAPRWLWRRRSRNGFSDQPPPMLWHIRDFLGARSLLAPALRWAASAARGAIAISEAVGRDARSLFPRLPIDIVHNAVDTNHFCPGAGNGRLLDDLAGLPRADAATIRIGLPATFARWKGHEVFLGAAAQLLREQPQIPVRFYIVGGAIYQTGGSQVSEQSLRQKATELEIMGRVGFIGFQRDPAPIYRALDIVVHASTEPEPFGRTIVEAMACARPVIATQTGGAAELFTHRHDALGVPPGDVGALASAMHALLSDPEARSRLAVNARGTTEARFTRERLGSDLLRVYHRYLNRAAAG
jgi:glycosyltransferase involved in cell wall biosynthesis